MKNTSYYIEKILLELETNRYKINDEEINQFIRYILNANRIFLSGSGRSGLVARAFANRLMHLGLEVSFIGDINTPHTKEGDILIINSGSGETSSLVMLAQKAKKLNMAVLLNTVNPKSSLFDLSDAAIVLPGSKKDSDTEASLQPMGSSFEQLSFILFDAIVLNLMKKLNETGKTMYERHANLE
ncbi:6-phospho-3-hexuloisomerase [Apibacter sp. HY039]|uniref:6-phospho-3-hexuloisomerase n=1 Tax=Apibacter sp. HY039 TaxID=2501476 RepID=UPI000FEBD235|nr:6-phospho-3-hexuloisomerase [Apibacter sp. HY039]